KIANLIDDIFFETIETDKEDVICFVGRLEFGKGSIMIDKIVRYLKHKYNFIVAGEIINFDTKIVDEYYNNASPEIIKQIYAKSKYLIYPSLYDTFALVIPEAISQRCIPVISPLPSLSVHKGVKRAKIDRLEEYLKLIEDESNNENLIKEGLEYIQQFHPRKFLEILKEGVEEFENYQIL
ncbi:MAG: glycosyltransferase, partial [Endomicrobia bacterium]|nr:glycosyltransferase [Endomicrobiia bacterium]